MVFRRKHRKIVNLRIGFGIALIILPYVYFNLKSPRKIYIRPRLNPNKTVDYKFDQHEWNTSYTKESNSSDFLSCDKRKQFLDEINSLLLLNQLDELLKRTIQNSTWKESLYGTMWPKDDDTETCNRLEEQNHFLNLYRKIKNATGGIKQPKIILRVNPFEWKPFREGSVMFTEDGCPVDWCTVTKDVKFYNTADAVILSNYQSENFLKLPKPSNQIWIYKMFEAPYLAGYTGMLGNLIDWTLTYRRDATVSVAYAIWKKENNPVLQQQFKNYAANKRNKVAMMVSNCKASNERLRIASIINEYIPVHIYGKCGNYSCPTGFLRHKCGEWLSRNYKFYLAFENANCKHYVTEKLLSNALLHDILPIVYGARKEDYQAVAPPGSFIYARDFGSVRKLVEHLLLLDKYDDLYNEYFKWKQYYKPVDPKMHLDYQNLWCRVCTLLHLQSDVGYVHKYKDFHLWWSRACPGMHRG